jgi:hypothetical protein
METNRVEQMISIQNEARELFAKKNKDYGDAFANYGTVGVIVRMGDKIQRMMSISKNGVRLVDNENLRDTLIDLHNYAAMAIMLMDEKLPIRKNDSNNDLIASNNDILERSKPLYC